MSKTSSFSLLRLFLSLFCCLPVSLGTKGTRWEFLREIKKNAQKATKTRFGRNSAQTQCSGREYVCRRGSECVLPFSVHLHSLVADIVLNPCPYCLENSGRVWEWNRQNFKEHFQFGWMCYENFSLWFLYVFSLLGAYIPYLHSGRI